MTHATELRHDGEALEHAARQVRWWPGILAFLLVGGAYALVAERLTLGPRWALLVIVGLAIGVAWMLRWRGMVKAGRWMAMLALVAITAAMTVSVAYLFTALVTKSADATELLQGGALLWVSNIFTFGLWYWEVDGGGPVHRHASKSGSTDFAFPQSILGDGKAVDWMPDFLDYLFLAFNTSTAFSPTDTMVLAQRAKLLMMYQSIVSLVTVVVLVARAINAL